jgi:hypothetical protein
MDHYGDEEDYEEDVEDLEEDEGSHHSSRSVTPEYPVPATVEDRLPLRVDDSPSSTPHDDGLHMQPPHGPRADTAVQDRYHNDDDTFNINMSSTVLGISGEVGSSYEMH